VAGPASIDTYLTPRARTDLAEAIADAGGNEVFFVGSPDEHGCIDDVEVYCRGHESAVPALRQVGRPGEVVIHNHPSGRLVPSEPDLALASHYGQEGVGFYIVNNDASAVYVVVERLKELQKELDPEAVEAALTADDGIGGALPGYEPRPGQVSMARSVATGQNGRKITIVEAGTGTGKSLAYLVPSAMRALANDQRVVIATRTRHLQQQLVDSDVPVVRRVLPDVRVAILKGRGNYLCRRKLGDRLKEGSTDESEQEFLVQIGRWAEATRLGDRDDLPFVPDSEHWELVQSSSEHTLRVKCPHYDECFYYSSRRQAAQANVLVANHHLLFADMALRRDGVAAGLLPRYEHVILDEAHHLEDVATDFAGSSLTQRGLLRHLGRLKPTRARKRGLLTKLRVAVEDADNTEETAEFRESVQRALDQVEVARETLKVLLEDVGWNVAEAAGEDREANPRSRRRRSVSFRLTDDLDKELPHLHRVLKERFDEGVLLLTAVGKCVEHVLDRMEGMPGRFQKTHTQTRMDLGSTQRRLLESAATMGTLLRVEAERVRWVELRMAKDAPPESKFFSRPIEAAAVIQDVVVPAAHSITLTSATLSIAGTFDHFRARTGFDGAEVGARVVTDSIASPFDYGKQVLFAVPDDLPEPSARDYEAAVVESVTEAIRIARGRSFVLFTSYAQLHRVADRVSRNLGRQWSILRQGELPRDRLLDLFKSRDRTALFGTDSFWEGVDVRGEALSCVILPRLPFRVPSEPVQVARAEAIAKRGGDAFSELSVPQAVLKFRQGFGRLIRHRDDRGVVLVLDTRIVRKGYGRRFMRSLPPGVEPLVAPLDDVLSEMAGFFGPKA